MLGSHFKYKSLFTHSHKSVVAIHSAFRWRPESIYDRKRFISRAYAVYRVMKLLMASHDDFGSITFTSIMHTNHICSHQRAARILS
jgi:hypothetical protein